MTMILDGSGSITGLVAGGLPDATVTQAEVATGVAGTGPAFSAYSAVNQTGFTNGTESKILFATEDFDTNGNYASSRFTPTVAGYYQINASIGMTTGSAATASNWISIFKNGSVYNRGNRLFTENPTRIISPTMSQLVYLNGSTDYVEIYGFSNGGTWSTDGSAAKETYFSGALARAA